jgi:hypothetical protein
MRRRVTLIALAVLAPAAVKGFAVLAAGGLLAGGFVTAEILRWRLVACALERRSRS